MKRLLFLASAICLVLMVTPSIPACGLAGASALQYQQTYYQQPQQLQLAPAYCIPQQQAPMYSMPQLDLPTCPTLGIQQDELQLAPQYGVSRQFSALQSYQPGFGLQLGRQVGYGAGLQLDIGGVGYGQNGVFLNTVDPVTGLVIDAGGGFGGHRFGRGNFNSIGRRNARGGRRNARGGRNRNRSRSRTRTRTRGR